MIRAKVLYAALLVIAVLFLILYRGKLSMELLIFAVLFPIPLWVSTFLLKRALHLRVLHSKEPILKGKPWQWIVEIENNSIFSTANALLKLEYYNSLTGKTQPLTLMVPVMSRNTQRVRLSFHTATCGVMRLHLTELSLYDPLRLFCRKQPLDLTDQIVIMPAPTDLRISEFPPMPQPDADSCEYSKNQAGDDPSEIFDLHAYREGDSVSRIHWKLSSKLDNLMVKEYSLPLAAGCLLVPDFRSIGTQPSAALRLDAALSALSAATALLSEQNIAYTMASYFSNSGMQESEQFSVLTDAAQWIRHLVMQQPAHPDEQAGMLRTMQDFFASNRQFERVMLFTPKLDAQLLEMLHALPDPERFLVFAVVTPAEGAFPENAQQPFHCYSVMLSDTAQRTRFRKHTDEKSDFDDSDQNKGGAGS